MSNAIATMNSAASQLRALPEFDISREQIELIKQTVMPQASDVELDLFINLCRAKRLDPLTKQIYAIKTERSGWQFFASIDGLRVIAQRSGEYLGQTAPFWCGPDGEWKDVWLQDEPPAAAKIGIWKRGNAEPTWGVATFREYGKGKRAPIWLSMPSIMLSKCAEALALRKAFPDDLSALYVREEFTEASDPSGPIKAQPRPRIDVVEAQVRGIPIDDDIIDAETGEIRSGQQALPADLPANGMGMISSQQRGRILYLAQKLSWFLPDNKTVDMGAINAYCGKEEGLPNLDLLSEQRAAHVIQKMESQL